MIAGQIIGQVTDYQGDLISGATITVRVAGQTRTAISDGTGWYRIPSLPSGRLTIQGELAGFQPVQQTLDFTQEPRQVDFQLAPAGVSETVTVSSEAPQIQRRNERDQRAQQEVAAAPSVNVTNLQRRAAGVLPVRIDVPRAGGSYRFVKPLVIDEETVVGFRYRTR
jgi:hypothetical protein